MGYTIQDLDIEIEQKDHRIEILEKKIRLPDCHVFEEMNRLGLNKIPKKKIGS